MNLRYSNHALRRLAQRGITQDDVEWALKRQLDPFPGQTGTVWLRGAAGGGRILKVCVPLHDHHFVITAVWE